MATAKKPAAKKKVARKAAPVKKVADPRKTTKPAKAKEKPAAKGKRTDYEAIERDYRTGSFTDQELATKYGKSRQAITKMAGAKSWKKDLSVAVRQATRASLIADQAAKKVAEQVAKGGEATLDTVLVVAETNKQVILGHRTDIAQARQLLNSMLLELQQITLQPKKLQELMDVLSGEDQMTAGQLADARDAFADLQRLPTRILSVARISQAMSRLQMLERKAFGLDEPEQPPPVDEVGDLTDDELDARIQERLERLNAKRAG